MSDEQRMAVLIAHALWSADETAAYLKVPQATLDQWAYQGIGPRYSKVGRYRRYQREHVDAWLDAQARGGPDAA